MSLPRNIQPTCAWPSPRSAPRQPGAWSTCGLCGSPGWSEKRWCLRWVATHSITGPSTAIEPSTASSARTVRGGLEAAVGEQPVVADGDAEPGQRVGDREHDQVVPVQGSAPRQPSAHASAAGGTTKTIVRTTRSDVSCSIGTISATVSRVSAHSRSRQLGKTVGASVEGRGQRGIDRKPLVEPRDPEDSHDVGIRQHDRQPAVACRRCSPVASRARSPRASRKLQFERSTISSSAGSSATSSNVCSSARRTRRRRLPSPRPRAAPVSSCSVAAMNLRLAPAVTRRPGRPDSCEACASMTDLQRLGYLAGRRVRGQHCFRPDAEVEVPGP